MLSILMATYNGADTISRCLEAMSKMQAPSGGWELIVVNNASTDDTEKRILEWRDRLPLLYIHEPRLGKAVAINTGLKHAKGDFVVMTDDDVLPDPEYLVEWRRVVDAYPQCSVFGGAIVPEFDSFPPPSYVPTHCYGILYGASEPFSEGELLPDNEEGVYFLGWANLGIRKSVYEEGRRFEEGFLTGKSGLMGGDANFVTRMAKQGHKIGFSPKSRLRHIIQRYQTEWRWIHERFFRDGRAKFMLLNVQQTPGSSEVRFRFPWRSVKGIVGSSVRYLFAMRDEKSAFRQSYALAYDLGAVRQALSLTWKTRFASRAPQKSSA